MHFSDLKAKLSSSHSNNEAMASLTLAGKVALVTGGSKGIGRATVLGLAKAGAQVVINYGWDANAAEEVVKEVGEKQALAVQADAGSVAGVQKIVKATIDAFGKIDILIANAGVLPMKDLEHTSEEDFDKTFASNVKGLYFLVQVSLSS
jgi:3-oxoacyl-[acyl-carrier protein] reductase